MERQQFMGNTRSKEVHDLDQEQPACQIDKILNAGHETPFLMLSTADGQGYHNCGHCMIASMS
jgi:hypothetical protein